MGWGANDDIARSLPVWYGPDLNRWSPAPWEKLDSELRLTTLTLNKVLVVKNQICFIVEDGPFALWTYSIDRNSLTSLFDWVEKESFCAVAVDMHIFVIAELYVVAMTETPPFRNVQDSTLRQTNGLK